MYMEDEFCIRRNIGGNENVSAIGVYDGHCGDKASKYCRDRMLDAIAENGCFDDEPVKAVRNGMRHGHTREQLQPPPPTHTRARAQSGRASH